MALIRLTLAEIRAKATELRQSFGDDARARALEWAAMRMEQAVREQDDEPLTLGEAAARSGYNPDSLRRLHREGRLHAVKRGRRLFFRAADLPMRAPRVDASDDQRYDPGARCSNGGREARAWRVISWHARDCRK